MSSVITKNWKELHMANPTDNPKSGQQNFDKNDPQNRQNDPSQQHGQQGQNDPTKDRKQGGNVQDETSDRRKAS
jgi:hypothetical protein